jgi:hypothetical protein
MTTNNDDNRTSLLSAAGIGRAVACCLAFELLGGTALLSGLVAAIGLSTGLTYVAVVGLGGILAALLVVGYQQRGRQTHGYVN